MNEEDDRALRYLENLTVDEYEDVKSGFKIGMVRLFCLSVSLPPALCLFLSVCFSSSPSRKHVRLKPEMCGSIEQNDVRLCLLCAV